MLYQNLNINHTVSGLKAVSNENFPHKICWNRCCFDLIFQQQQHSTVRGIKCLYKQSSYVTSATDNTMYRAVYTSKYLNNRNFLNMAFYRQIVNKLF